MAHTDMPLNRYIRTEYRRKKEQPRSQGPVCEDSGNEVEKRVLLFAQSLKAC